MNLAWSVPTVSEQVRRRQVVELSTWARIRRFLHWALARPVLRGGR